MVSCTEPRRLPQIFSLRQLELYQRSLKTDHSKVTESTINNISNVAVKLLIPKWIFDDGKIVLILKQWWIFLEKVLRKVRVLCKWPS